MNAFQILSLLMVTLAGFFLLSCATPVHRAIEEISVGDDKGKVLEEAGNPKHSARRDGQDLWIYRYYKGDREYRRSVRFEESKVSYIGPEIQIRNPKEALIEQELENLPFVPDEGHRAAQPGLGVFILEPAPGGRQAVDPRANSLSGSACLPS